MSTRTLPPRVVAIRWAACSAGRARLLPLLSASLTLGRLAVTGSVGTVASPALLGGGLLGTAETTAVAGGLRNCATSMLSTETVCSSRLKRLSSPAHTNEIRWIRY
jgi:hypothetical protein